MHELVREWSTAGGAGAILARLPMDQGGLTAAFAPGRGGSRLLWLAKTVRGEAACARLRAERLALERLAPLAESLGLPRVLAGHESGHGEAAEACLLQTAVEGKPMRVDWHAAAGRAPLPREMMAAGDWLRRFQRLCRERPELKPGLSLAELGRLVQSRLAAAPEPAGALLAPLLAQLDDAAGAAECIPIHGDFWAGNLIRSGRRGEIGVVDWSGFGPGSALDDLLTFMASLPCRTSDGAGTRLQGWRQLWFEPGRAQQYLRVWAAEAEYGPAQARFAFYLFLARRLGWEMGLDLQARNRAERAAAHAHWTATLAWLRQNRFPDPFTISSPA